ncbi:hypothetical protein TSAR_003780 [Trichomalopsis sarcophagae]|uniref:Uncharacterized protein n=1 Tax=Trichomalopsis sarcophagae TaxID=543379 RepID=A0A232FHH4_9HYME|nr:hypothetical protein TSAR_003780 [Trichomalopsis sarcophagae]
MEIPGSSPCILRFCTERTFSPSLFLPLFLSLFLSFDERPTRYLPYRTPRGFFSFGAFGDTCTELRERAAYVLINNKVLTHIAVLKLQELSVLLYFYVASRNPAIALRSAHIGVRSGGLEPPLVDLWVSQGEMGELVPACIRVTAYYPLKKDSPITFLLNI